MSTIWLDLLGAEVLFTGTKYRTRTIQAGSGEPLILLHGLGGHAEAYSRNLMNLSKRFRVIAMDFVWHGLSATPPYDGQSIPTYAAQVMDLLDTLGIDRAYVEGESLGGWVALWLATHHPERLKKMVLNTTGGVLYRPGSVNVRAHEGVDALRDRSLAVIEKPSTENVRSRLEWLMARPDRVTDELISLRQALYRQPNVRDSLKQVFSHRFSPDGAKLFHFQEDDLSRINTPALVLWTDKNPGMGPDVGQHLASLIPGAQFACINDAAHWPQWEQPEQHDRLMLDFLSS